MRSGRLIDSINLESLQLDRDTLFHDDRAAHAAGWRAMRFAVVADRAGPWKRHHCKPDI